MAKRKKIKTKILFFLILVVVIFFSIKRVFFPIKEITNSDEKRINLCRVIGVYDGDTIKVKFPNGSINKIRLIGVDCPELDTDREEIRVFANIAKRFTYIKLFKKRVKLAHDWEFKDKYGRILAYVWINETLFNELIIKEGFAFSFLKFPFRKDFQERFQEAEKWARIHKRGLWSIGKESIISPHDSFSHIGEYLGVKFKCKKIFYGRKYIFLDSSLDYKHTFSALIPISERKNFKNIEKMKNRILVAKGLLEKYKDKTQMMIFSPSQIEIKTRID